MKCSQLIKMIISTIVGIFIFIGREILLAFSYLIAEQFSSSAIFSKKEFAIVSNLRFINGKFHAQLS